MNETTLVQLEPVSVRVLVLEGFEMRQDLQIR